MRALVISGGGAKASFAGGVAEYLIRKAGRSYDLFAGTSAGALLIPFLAAGELALIKDIFHHTGQSDIFSVHPFKLICKNGSYDTRIHHLGILKQFIKGRKTFGESYNLRRLLRKHITQELYDKILNRDKRVVVTVSNFTYKVLENKYLRDCTPGEFADWVWRSCNFVPFMTLSKKDGSEYGDGGFGSYLPIDVAIDAGATEIDVIVLSPAHPIADKTSIDNAFELFMRVGDFMIEQQIQSNKYIALLESMQHPIKINYFHTPVLLTNNPLLFIPHQMRQWWSEGFAFAKETLQQEDGMEGVSANTLP